MFTWDSNYIFGKGISKEKAVQLLPNGSRVHVYYETEGIGLFLLHQQVVSMIASSGNGMTIPIIRFETLHGIRMYNGIRIQTDHRKLQLAIDGD